MCRRLAGNDADAADATQEALITIVRRLDRYDGRSAFGTWVYRVATNACLDELRRRSRRPLPSDEPETAGRAAADPGGTDAVDARLDIDSALSSVPIDFRVAVILRDLCDLDYGEIAEILGVAKGTVKSRIARGRAALAERLGNRSDPSTRPTH